MNTAFALSRQGRHDAARVRVDHFRLNDEDLGMVVTEET